MELNIHLYFYILSQNCGFYITLHIKHYTVELRFIRQAEIYSKIPANNAFYL